MFYLTLRVMNRLVLLFLFVQFSFGQSHRADIVIYGATSSGVTAAIEASRLGNQVILIEPSNLSLIHI